MALQQRAEATVAPLLWRHQRELCDELFDAARRMSFDHTPCVIHGDLAPYHVLHDPASGRLTSVLDFGLAGLGDPAVDLACLLTALGESTLAGEGGLERAWPAMSELVDRARLLAMLLPLEWAVRALESDDREMAVAHLGDGALDVGFPGTPFGSSPR